MTIVFMCFFLMVRRQPRSTRTDPLFPYTTLVRSASLACLAVVGEQFRTDSRLRHSVFRCIIRFDAQCLGGVPGPAGIIEGGASDDHEVRLPGGNNFLRSEEHTSELPSLMRISYAVFCLTKKKITTRQQDT